jgi:TPR repeat protein
MRVQRKHRIARSRHPVSVWPLGFGLMMCLMSSCATPTVADLMRHLAVVTVACLDDQVLSSCEEACNAKVPEACLQLGNLWKEEDAGSEEQRHVVAWEWACQLGAPRGCVNVAQVLEGRSDSDPAQVGLHLEVACSQGDVEGCLELARWLASTETRWADLERSQALYEALCDRDVSKACDILTAQEETMDAPLPVSETDDELQSP